MVMALIDCNAFFCSCERVFEPKLRGRPVVVLSNNDGCAIARTSEAKALGIKMGEPYFKIRELCQKHNVAIFSSNFALYTDMSRRVMQLLQEFSSRVEVYSVDEAFIDLNGVNNPLEYAHKIKKEIEMQTKISVSVGVASTKALTKVACHIAKRKNELKGVLCLLDKVSIDKALREVAVGKLWGIGSKRALRLNLLGIKTAYDFKNYDKEKVIQRSLTKLGKSVQDELNEVICFPLTLEKEKKKEIMSSRTFPYSVYDLKTLKESVAGHASSVAEELRMQGSVCSEVLVYVRSNPFKADSIQYGRSVIRSFLTPSSNTFELIEKAFECLEEIWMPGIEYKKAGVRVMKLHDTYMHALSLFNSYDIQKSQKQDKLMQTMDRINQIEGPRTIESLACGIKGFSWQMSRSHLSARYTTSWNDLPKCW